MTDAWLKSAADRINRLLDEKLGIGADIADVFLEAKSKGYVPKVLRKAITRQRMEPAKRQEEDSILELYEAALDGPTREAVKLAAQGVTARDIETATGISRSAVSRSVPLNKNGGTKNVASPSGPSVGVPQLAPAPKGEDGASTNSTAESHDGPTADRNGGGDDEQRRLNPTMEEVARVAPPPIPAIDLTIPPHLRHERTA